MPVSGPRWCLWAPDWILSLLRATSACTCEEKDVCVCVCVLYWSWSPLKTILLWIVSSCWDACRKCQPSQIPLLLMNMFSPYVTRTHIGVRWTVWGALEKLKEAVALCLRVGVWLADSCVLQLPCLSSLMRAGKQCPLPPLCCDRLNGDMRGCVICWLPNS